MIFPPLPSVYSFCRKHPATKIASSNLAGCDSLINDHWSLTTALLVRQRFHAGQLLAFKEFEAGAAAGGDVGDLVGYAGLVDGAHGIAAADDRRGRTVGCYGSRNGVGAHGKARE